MIDVKCFACNMLQTNCYVVSDETHEAVIIDCGAFYDEERLAVVNYVRNNQLVPVHLLCTHGHFDHVFGNDTIHDEFGLLPEVSENDLWLIEDVGRQLKSMMGLDISCKTPPVGHLLRNNERIAFGSHQFTVLPTPGHTPGSVIFYCEEERVAFSGDTLFRMSIGRTDFERGSWDDMQASLLGVVAQLPADTRVYCGHGPSTVIGEEVRMSPYFR